MAKMALQQLRNLIEYLTIADTSLPSCYYDKQVVWIHLIFQ